MVRALLIADDAFTSREATLLTRVEVGLTGEGGRVVIATPERVGPLPGGAGLSHRATYEDRGWAVTGPSRARALLERVERFELPAPSGPAGERPVDIVHAFGDGAWSMARQVAAEAGASLVCEVWSSRSVLHAARAEARARRAPRDGARGLPAVWLAADDGLREALARALPAAPVRSAPWGVTTGAPRAEHGPRDLAGSWSAAVVGSGRDAGACVTALRGFARAAERWPGAGIVLDGALLRTRHTLWREARALGLLDRLTVIDGLEGRRDLALRCDILLLPEASGERRTIALDAMASGVAVVAAEDPGVSSLQPGRTCVGVVAPAPAAWGAAILGAVADLSGERRIVRGARAYVEHERQASAYVRAVVSAYEWTLGHAPIAIGAGSRVV